MKQFALVILAALLIASSSSMKTFLQQSAQPNSGDNNTLVNNTIVNQTGAQAGSQDSNNASDSANSGVNNITLQNNTVLNGSSSSANQGDNTQQNSSNSNSSQSSNSTSSGNSTNGTSPLGLIVPANSTNITSALNNASNGQSTLKNAPYIGVSPSYNNAPINGQQTAAQAANPGSFALPRPPVSTLGLGAYQPRPGNLGNQGGAGGFNVNTVNGQYGPSNLNATRNGNATSFGNGYNSYNQSDLANVKSGVATNGTQVTYAAPRTS